MGYVYKPSLDSFFADRLATGDNIRGNVIVHPTAKIGTGCILGPNVVIGPGVTLGAGVCVQRATLLDNVSVDSHA